MAKIAALYSYPEPFVLDDEELEEFLNRVAMVNLTPYLREALAATVARLRVEMPVMPLITAGTVRQGEPAESPMKD